MYILSGARERPSRGPSAPLQLRHIKTYQRLNSTPSSRAHTAVQIFYVEPVPGNHHKSAFFVPRGTSCLSTFPTRRTTGDLSTRLLGTTSCVAVRALKCSAGRSRYMRLVLVSERFEGTRCLCGPDTSKISGPSTLLGRPKTFRQKMFHVKHPRCRDNPTL